MGFLLLAAGYALCSVTVAAAAERRSELVHYNDVQIDVVIVDLQADLASRGRDLEGDRRLGFDGSRRARPSAASRAAPAAHAAEDFIEVDSPFTAAPEPAETAAPQHFFE